MECTTSQKRREHDAKTASSDPDPGCGFLRDHGAEGRSYYHLLLDVRSVRSHLPLRHLQGARALLQLRMML